MPSSSTKQFSVQFSAHGTSIGTYVNTSSSPKPTDDSKLNTLLWPATIDVDEPVSALGA